MRMNISMALKSLLLLIIFASISACKSSKNIVQEEKISRYYFDGKVKFLNAKDMTEAIEFAEEMKKPLFVEFYTDWCLPCKMLSEQVFVSNDFANMYNANFINYKINAEDQHGANMKFLYGVQEVPTLIFVDHQGKEIERLVGTTHESTLMNSASRVLQNWSTAEE